MDKRHLRQKKKVRVLYYVYPKHDCTDLREHLWDTCGLRHGSTRGGYDSAAPEWNQRFQMVYEISQKHVPPYQSVTQCSQKSVSSCQSSRTSVLPNGESKFSKVCVPSASKRHIKVLKRKVCVLIYLPYVGTLFLTFDNLRGRLWILPLPILLPLCLTGRA